MCPMRPKYDVSSTEKNGYIFDLIKPDFAVITNSDPNYVLLCEDFTIKDRRCCIEIPITSWRLEIEINGQLTPIPVYNGSILPPGSDPVLHNKITGVTVSQSGRIWPSKKAWLNRMLNQH